MTRWTGFVLAIFATAGLALGAPVCCAVGLNCCHAQAKAPVEDQGECCCCTGEPKRESDPTPAPWPCECDEKIVPIGTFESTAKIQSPEAGLNVVEFDLVVAVPADGVVLLPEGRDTPVPISRFITLPLLI